MYAMLYVNYISIKLEKSKSAPVFQRVFYPPSLLCKGHNKNEMLP